MKSFQPDPRFRVRMVTLGDIVLFFPLGPIPQGVNWLRVPGARVVLAGDVAGDVAGLVANYNNKEAREKLGLHPATLRALRLHLGIAADTNGRGGARPGSGQKKTTSTPTP